jgi:peptide/nickel transport system substrate-binding protein
VIPDDDARADALARGEIQLAQIKPQHVPRLRALEHLRVYRMRTGAWRGMPLNLRRPALKDVRVRRAIDLAIDREAIVAAALAGFGQAAYSPVPPVSWAFDPAMNQPRHDPARAEQLLEEAGWRRNAAGLRAREGEVLELNFIVWKEEIFRRTAAVLLRAQLEALGLRVNLHLVDGATYNRLADNMGTDYDTFIGGWGGLLDPGDNLGKKFHSRGSQNYMGYVNTEVDRLLARARALPAQRRAEARRLYRELVERVTADAVFLPLAYPDYVFAADARLSLGPYSLPAEAGQPPSAESGRTPLAGPPILDSWYEFPKFAHLWSWQQRE